MIEETTSLPYDDLSATPCVRYQSAFYSMSILNALKAEERDLTVLAQSLYQKAYFKEVDSRKAAIPEKQKHMYDAVAKAQPDEAWKKAISGSICAEVGLTAIKKEIRDIVKQIAIRKAKIAKEVSLKPSGRQRILLATSAVDFPSGRRADADNLAKEYIQSYVALLSNEGFDAKLVTLGEVASKTTAQSTVYAVQANCEPWMFDAFVNRRTTFVRRVHYLKAHGIDPKVLYSSLTDDVLAMFDTMGTLEAESAEMKTRMEEIVAELENKECK